MSDVGKLLITDIGPLLIERAATPANSNQPGQSDQSAAAPRVYQSVYQPGEIAPAPVRRAVSIPNEAQLLTILRTAVSGTAHAGFAAKEQALKAEFATLSLLESRELHRRLTLANDGDVLVAAFRTLCVERRSRLLQFLADARRRAALAPRRAA